MITINSLVISDDINMKGVERACDALRRDISNTFKYLS